MKLGIGIFTVYKNFLADLPDTLKRLAEIGYEGVELYGNASWPPELVRQNLECNGLTLCGWHTEWRLLQPDTIRKTIAYHKAVGNHRLIIPAMGGPWNIAHSQEEDSEQVWHQHAVWMNQVIKLLSEESLQLGYHTHAHEFSTRYPSGKTPWNILTEECPELLLELDTGNCIEGGGIPQKALEESGTRSVLIHCKPYSHQKGFEVPILDSEDENNWDAILEAADRGHTKWLLLEEEASGLGDAFTLTKQSFQRMKRLLSLKNDS